MKHTFLITLFISILLILNFSISAQVENGYKGILPIKSNCQDVERVLNIKACNEPKVIFNSNFEKVIIFFTTEVCDETIFKMRLDSPIGTVSRVSIDYKDPIPLDTIKINLDEFKKSTSDSNIETFFLSKEKGLEITIVRSFPEDSNRIVRRISYYPLQNAVKLCTPDKNNPKPIDWKENFNNQLGEGESYWNLPLKEEKLRIERMIPNLKEVINAVEKLQILIVYQYKTLKDIKLAQKQAIRAKKMFEKGGINPSLIKVIDGGGEDKSEIIIYLNVMR